MLTTALPSLITSQTATLGLRSQPVEPRCGPPFPCLPMNLPGEMIAWVLDHGIGYSGLIPSLTLNLQTMCCLPAGFPILTE